MNKRGVDSELASVIVVSLLLLGTCNGNVIDKCGGLSYNYYDKACPQLQHIVRASLSSAFLLDPSSPPALLRLMFHDCQVQGCDASILVDQPTEMDSAKNFGIRKRELIGAVKAALELVCPKQVSCADVIILAAREAVALSGGPLIAVPLGRKDAVSTPGSHVADALLPPATADVDSVLRLFGAKGMTVEESVAIMGAHTLGVTHCNNAMQRFNNTSKSAKDNIDPQFEKLIRLACPQSFPFSSKYTFILNDQTSTIFDTNYYENTIGGRGPLRVDTEMATDPRTQPFVRAFAADPNLFLRSFSSAFVKLSCSNVLTGTRGNVRSVCHKVN
ncbi:PREDICTED: peroxidase 29 [Tarenaya hassleriana]|uniref:peroxidase 29 n=1 Tax=Tarenaya hassleriana TaxID=28532 RepID=UPI00053C8D7F|nr:PREDICTED: peroxidase 29 [Tarenaya hassleriana]